MNFYRLDITYVVGRLSEYTQYSNQDRWNVVIRLIKHLRGTMDYTIEYNGFSVLLKGYNDGSH